LSRSNFNKMSAWTSAVRSIGAEGLHFHDLRRTGNTFAASGGAGIKDLMARMGHDSERAALIYQHEARGADKMLTSRPSSTNRKVRTARPVCWCQQGNGPLMARKVDNYIVEIEPQRGLSSELRTTGGAGDGNRTRMTSLEGWSSTIELRPQQPPRSGAAVTA